MAKEDLVRYQFTSNQDRKKAAENGRKGGKSLGAKRRANKTFREIAIALLSSELTQAEKETLKKGFSDIDVDMLTRKAAILAVQVKNAMKGDLKSAQWVQEVAGEKDAEKVEISGEMKPFAIERIYSREQVKKEEDK